MTDPLARYRDKRDFDVTAEPRGVQQPDSATRSFVIQKHAASRLHYDFRLELGGVLVSWAVPKGPSYDPADKRMAIHVEDHPIGYGDFEGTIPKGQYGAGTVIVWDHGHWEPVGDPHEGLRNGKLVFHLHGQKLKGIWELVRIAKSGEKQEPWILFKKRDGLERSKADYDVLTALPDSVIARPLTKHAIPAASAGATARAAGQTAAKNTGPPASGVRGAALAPLPATLKPQLATLATGVPRAGRWSYEIKFDGYRIMTRVEQGKATLITRGGHDWSRRMPDLVQAVEQLGLTTAWLDGEIVLLNDDGVPDFNRLQKAFDHRGSAAAEIVYFLFDLPYIEGYDLREVALQERRKLLKLLLTDSGIALETLMRKRGATRRKAVGRTARSGEGPLRYSADFEADAASILASACQMNLEGLIAKRSDAPYVSARNESWLKLKCKKRQEFVVCGYTDRSDGSPQIGSLLLGVHDASGALVSVGSVGTGWDAKEAAALKRKLALLKTDEAPFSAGAAGAPKASRWSRRAAGSECWVQTSVVAEVEFADWTPDGQIRHAVYVALRRDKNAKSVVREVALAPAGAAPVGRAGKAAVGGVRVSHGDRVIDPTTGLTKLDLVRYYESVADWILPHLVGRPISMLRAPGGIEGEQFFQKHDDKLSIPGLRELDAALWPAHPPLLEVPSAQAVVSAAQMNVMEFHTWNSKVEAIKLPDRLVFDLDPGEGTSWQHVQEAALLVRSMLTQLGLECWLKTSGGKGLHVVVPLTPKLDYDTVKGFSRAVVQHLAKTIPSRFVAKSGPTNRVGKLFVDYLRNGFGATTAAAFSARARPGLGVSMPVSWDDLIKLKGGAQWTVATARDHLSFRTADPWKRYWKQRQSLTKAMKALAFDPRAAPDESGSQSS